MSLPARLGLQFPSPKPLPLGEQALSPAKDESAAEAEGLQAGWILEARWVPRARNRVTSERQKHFGAGAGAVTLLEFKLRINSIRFGTKHDRSVGSPPKAPFLISLGSEGCC